MIWVPSWKGPVLSQITSLGSLLSPTEALIEALIGLGRWHDLDSILIGTSPVLSLLLGPLPDVLLSLNTEY